MILLRGMKFEQAGKTLYLSAVSGAQLDDWRRRGYLDVDMYGPEPARQDGYQRPLEPNRVRKLARFLTGGERTLPLMPHCLVLNLRDRKVGWNPEVGEISIPEGAVLWEVDGQHRIAGLLEAMREDPNLRNYMFPVVITELDRPTEAIQFILINTRQKKVPTALTLRTLARRYRQRYAEAMMLLQGKEWIPDAIDIMDGLATDPQSPWHGRIRPIGKRGRSKELLVPEQTFFMSLEHLIGKGRALEGKGTRYVKDFLLAFWKALKDRYPRACDPNSANEYFLMKGPGVVSMHMIAGLVYYLTDVLEGDPLKADHIRRIFDRMRLNERFWHGESPYYGPVGYRRLADKITKALIRRYELDYESCEKQVKKGSLEEKLLKRGASLIAPLRLYKLFRPSIVRREVSPGASGAYVLFSARGGWFYTGGTQRGDLRDRILQHVSEDYDLFNFGFAKTPNEALVLECTLYHLLRKTKLKTRRHPRTHCPYC